MKEETKANFWLIVFFLIMCGVPGILGVFVTIDMIESGFDLRFILLLLLAMVVLLGLMNYLEPNSIIINRILLALFYIIVVGCGFLSFIEVNKHIMFVALISGVISLPILYYVHKKHYDYN